MFTAPPVVTVRLVVPRKVSGSTSVVEPSISDPAESAFKVTVAAEMPPPLALASVWRIPAGALIATPPVGPALILANWNGVAVLVLPALSCTNEPSIALTTPLPLLIVSRLPLFRRIGENRPPPMPRVTSPPMVRFPVAPMFRSLLPAVSSVSAPAMLTVEPSITTRLPGRMLPMAPVDITGCDVQQCPAMSTPFASMAPVVTLTSALRLTLPGNVMAALPLRRPVAIVPTP